MWPAEHRLPQGARAGFTLPEVMVALLVSAIAIAGARAVFGALVDHSDAIAVARNDAARAANGARVLRQLVLQAEAGADPTATFAGTAQRARFDTWCLTPQGWSERCVAELTLGADDFLSERGALRATLSTGEQLTLLRLTAPARFGYLENAAHGGTWSDHWGPGVIAPRAIGILTPRDTLVLRAGMQP